MQTKCKINKFLVYQLKKRLKTFTMSMWSEAAAVSAAECMAHMAQPTSTPGMSSCDDEMLPKVLPPATSA